MRNIQKAKSEVKKNIVMVDNQSALFSLNSNDNVNVALVSPCQDGGHSHERWWAYCAIDVDTISYWYSS